MGAVNPDAPSLSWSLSVSEADVERARATGAPISVFPSEAAAYAEQIPAVPKRNYTPPSVYVSGGEVQSEPNPRLAQAEWFGSQGHLGRLDTMIREWATLQAGALAWTLTTLSREWSVDPPKGGDANDLMIAEFADTAIRHHFRGMGGGMLGLMSMFAPLPVRGFILGQPYYPVDKSIQVRDKSGRIVLDGAHTLQIAPIPACFVEDWLPRTGPHGARQWGASVYDVGSDGMDARFRGAGSRVNLEPHQLVHARFLPTGEDPAPYGLMRPAYVLHAEWSTLSKLEVNGWQKAAFGVPEIVIGPNANPAELAGVNRIVSNLRVGATIRFSLPDGYSIKWHEVPFRAGDITKTKQSLKMDALVGMFCQHLGTGSDNGTQALHGSQKAEFHQLAEIAARTIQQTLAMGPTDTAPIKRLVALNFGAVSAFPSLRYGPAPVVDPGLLVEAIGNALASGALTVDGGIEDSIRAALSLPEMPEETREQWRARLENASPPELVTPPEAPDDDDPSTPPKPDGGGTDEGGESAEDDADASDVVQAAEGRDGALDPAGVAALRAEFNAFKASFRPALSKVRVITNHHVGEAVHRHETVLPTRGIRDVRTLLDASRVVGDRIVTGPRGRLPRAAETVLRFSETAGATSAGKDAVAEVLESWRIATAPDYAGVIDARAKDLADVATLPVPGQADLIRDLKVALRQVYRAGARSAENELERLEADPELVKQIRDGDVEPTRTATMREGCCSPIPMLDARTLAERLPFALANAPGRKLKKPAPAPGLIDSVLDDIDPEDAIDGVARTTAAATAARMRTAATTALQSAGIGGALPPKGVAAIVSGAVEALSPGVERNQAQGDVNTLFGLGRQQQQRADGVERYMFSNLLESDTCEPCGDLDGTVFGAEDLDAYATPYAGCEGGDRCNCLVIGIPSAEG